MDSSENIKGQRALLRFLQREGRISAVDAVRFEQLALKNKCLVHEVLEQEGVISERDLAALLSDSLRLPLLDLSSFPFDPQIGRALKESIATKHEVVPIKLDEGTIEVATANPLDLEALKAVEFATGRRTLPSVATRTEVRDALSHVYRLEESLDRFLQNVPHGETLTVVELSEERADLRSAVREAELPPVVKLADLILVEGIKTGASDVHLEPAAAGIIVRYRIDGILEEGFRFPKWVQNPLITRFKVMAKLDITERRVPQDGRIQARFREGTVDLRVSSLPTQNGEKITMRILDPNRGIHSLEEIGLEAADLQRLREAVKKPEGMILVTGPTGSGKTTTLYSLLRECSSRAVNIVTIENPIEYELPGINQVQINERQGLTFATVLRSVLRQDPDIILVGEIRDKETAVIAFQAAQTGHLVLSTLHTNDAAATVTRLLDLGLEPYVVASSLNLIIAQRLVRRVCTRCSAPYSPPDESRRLLRLDDFRRDFRRGLGCPECRQSGYSGRVAVYEMFPVSQGINRLIEQGTPESALRHQSRADGHATLLEDAITKLSNGVTTAEEILRVIQIGEDRLRCPGCDEEIEAEFSVCPHCTKPLRNRCEGCGGMMNLSWATCPYCGGKKIGAAAGPLGPDRALAAPPSALSAPANPLISEKRELKALVADDDPDLRRIVRLTLEGAGLGLTVMTARDGAEALALADVDRPDVVLLDLSMPEVDGFEVCRRLRADVRTAFVPILMLTAADAEESVTKGFQAGTDDYIVKPFRRQDLVARVKRMLERTYGKEIMEAAAELKSAPAKIGQPAATSGTAA